MEGIPRKKVWGQIKYFKLLFIISISLVLLTIFLKPIANLYFQMSAQKVIAGLTGKALVDGNFLACSNEIELSEIEFLNIEKVTKELQDFNKSIFGGGRINLLLGKLECFKRNYSDAVNHFRIYLFGHPKDPLANLEFCFALMNASIKNQEDKKLVTVADIQEIRQALSNSGFDDAQVIGAAEDYFYQGNFSIAESYFNLIQTISSVPIEKQFHFDIAQLINQKRKPDHIYSQDIIEVNDSVKIVPENMVMLSNNQPLLVRNINNQSVGALITSKDRAIFLGWYLYDKYCFTVSSLGLPPAPTILTITVDQVPVHEIVISSEDGKLSDYFFTVNIGHGFHMVGIEFSNDLFANGLDRNGYVGPIKIDKCQ